MVEVRLNNPRVTAPEVQYFPRMDTDQSGYLPQNPSLSQPSHVSDVANKTAKTAVHTVLGSTGAQTAHMRHLEEELRLENLPQSACMQGCAR